MLFKQRIFHGDNGTLVDLSAELNDIFKGTKTLPIVAAQDFIYIGSDLPFTHRFIEVSTANTANASISEIAIWDGSDWVPAVDIMDLTSSGGKTLARSGIVSWTTERNSQWSQESTTEDMTASGIQTLKIYDFYWVRLRFSADLSLTTAVSYMGHRFADDDDMSGYYPDLLKPAVIDSFESGKADWNEQHLLAAEEIIKYLRQKKLIWSPNQLLNWQQFTIASVHKCAEIIFAAFPGDDFGDQRAMAKKNYFEQINQGIYETDRDEDGHVDDRERRQFTGLVRR